jgi:hydrogenase nickel incorporation protein HypB
MCATCGCEQEGMVQITTMRDVLFTPMHHTHQHNKPVRTQIDLEQDILLKNNLLAERNRGYFLAKEILAINLVSSPGSGKTSLLEKTLRDLKEEISLSVIEGDQQTTNDADRIATTGVPVTQINTGKGCHLDAQMVWDALQELKPKNQSTVFIENIGNLVCPSMFNLGEQKRVVIISVTEGDDKPLKYPDMFASSQLCVINKIDLLPYVNFSTEKVKEYARRINPTIEFLEVSCTSEEGLKNWYDWLRKEFVVDMVEK